MHEVAQSGERGRMRSAEGGRLAHERSCDLIGSRRLSLALCITLLGSGLLLGDCGARIDDGWDGLSLAGNVDALAPPGSRCANYDAAAWLSHPPCVQNDDCVADGAPVVSPPGWPPPICIGLVDARSCSAWDGINYDPLTCVVGDVGDAYCRAWYAQFVLGDATINALCADGYCMTECSPNVISVSRAVDGGSQCEIPCQPP